MLSIMEASLPPEVVNFLTPDTDDYTTVLLGGKNTRRPIRPIPIEALVSVPRHLLADRQKHRDGSDTAACRIEQLGGW